MSRRNQTIAIARFLSYKAQLNSRLDGMSDEEYEKEAEKIADLLDISMTMANSSTSTAAHAATGAAKCITGAADSCTS